MSRCEDVRELLSKSLDTTLVPDERAQVDAHLTACTVCTAWFSEVRISMDVLSQHRRLGLPDSFAGAVLHRASEERRRRRTLWFRAAALSAAAAVMLVVGLVFVWRPARTGVNVEAARIRAGEHLNAADLFFGQVAKLEARNPKAELALVDNEMKGSQLSDRTQELYTLAPALPKPTEVTKYAEKVDHLLLYISANRATDRQAVLDLRNRVRGENISATIESLSLSLQIKPRPLSALATVESDPGTRIFLQGRMNMYSGNYGLAARDFAEVSEETASPVNVYASFWLADAQRRAGNWDEALTQYVMLPSPEMYDGATITFLRDAAHNVGEVRICGKLVEQLDDATLSHWLAKDRVMIVNSGHTGRKVVRIDQVQPELVTNATTRLKALRVMSQIHQSTKGWVLNLDLESVPDAHKLEIETLLHDLQKPKER